MNEKLVKCLSCAKYEPSADLNENIWKAVIDRSAHVARVKLWVFSSVLVCSLAALVPMLEILFAKFAQSGIYEYISLAFSDLHSTATLWKEFGLVLTESLPVATLTVSLVLVLIFFLCLRSIMKQIIIKNHSGLMRPTAV